MSKFVVAAALLTLVTASQWDQFPEIHAPGVIAAKLECVDEVFTSDVFHAWNIDIDDNEETADGASIEDYGIEHLKVISDHLNNRLTFYTLNLSVGSPPQYFPVQVDTGSSDLWVPSALIKFDGFEPVYSRTFKYLGDDFEIEYVKDTAAGYWGMDTIGIGENGLVKDQQFAIATHAVDADVGILGLGPIAAEATNVTYPNFTQSLVNQGLIKRNVFSMYLNNLNSKQATILFGGADKARYHKTARLQPQRESINTVKVDNIKVGDTQVLDEPTNVLLDSGTSLCYLPEEQVTKIAEYYNATFNPTVQMYVVHAQDLADRELRGLDFTFKDVDVHIPHDELFWPLSWFTLQANPFFVMTVLPSNYSQNFTILGDSFLRSAYVIYDLDNHEVEVGPLIHTDSTDVVAL